MKYNKTIKILTAIIITLSTVTGAFAAISTDAKLQYNKGIDYYRLGQYEQAAQCFKNAVELDPNYIDAYYNLGSILEYLKQEEAALSVFKQIILRKPDDYESVYKAALLSKKFGEYDKANMYLSLIPQDSIMGSKAKQLSSSMAQLKAKSENQIQDTVEKIETTQQQAIQSIQKPLQTVNSAVSSNKVYNDISSPTGVVADEEGILYVAGFSDNTIYKINKDNKKIVYIKSEKIDGPIGIAMDMNKNMYIANYNKNNVLKYDPNGTITELIENVDKPYCLYVKSGVLYVSSQGGNSVIQFKL